jgi:hypothetical protein
VYVLDDQLDVSRLDEFDDVLDIFLDDLLFEGEEREVAAEASG